MTNSELIKEWLRACKFIEIVDIDTDRLEAQAESMGIYKQATRDVDEYIDGSKLISEYYYFLTRQSAQLESERIGAQEFLSQIEGWVEESEYNEIYPKIPGIERVFIANGFYMTDAETDESVYQISIGITYQKERN